MGNVLCLQGNDVWFETYNVTLSTSTQTWLTFSLSSQAIVRKDIHWKVIAENIYKQLSKHELDMDSLITSNP